MLNLLPLDQASLEEFRNVLDSVKQSTGADNTADFDPSGTSHVDDDPLSQSSSERAGSRPNDATSSSADTEDTELSGALSAFGALHLNNENGVEGPPSEHQLGWTALPFEAKADILKEMFPVVKSVDISYILKRSGDRYDRTVEELLNRAFLEDDTNELGEKSIKRSIEGFSEPTFYKTRKRRGKKASPHDWESSTLVPQDNRSSIITPAPLSQWDRAREDVQFITARTHLPQTVIASTYHKHAVSLASTIAAICRSERHENPYVKEATPPLLETQAAELTADFPTLDPHQSHALVRLTYPSTASAHELARALVTKPYAVSEAIITPHYQAPDLSSDSMLESLSAARRAIPVETAERLDIIRHQAYHQASAAHRVSKSKPLMGGAAAYYSSVARDASDALRQRESAQAEATVVGQSRSGEVDLHGVQVRDAQAIASRKAEQWWESSGREWAREGKARNGGLRIITGRGQHSQGGKGRLGPAVGAMLVREGWKVEVGEGVIDVVGKVRR
ncbi:uncharacterized protein KY384_002650 [Bacidia gigantensis]|uniref:uncharacterized protein n=1 Tax=Bacidia gigantensis TaxID=2732470 RepID=UPI001D043F09|nr:uncharacterized protein KY384_002650 [Bacidia gigantensis]KAG8532772.1 hypothetical protein KY384_002650 [Bacidia gigantensis]